MVYKYNCSHIYSIPRREYILYQSPVCTKMYVCMQNWIYLHICTTCSVPHLHGSFRNWGGHCCLRAHTMLGGTNIIIVVILLVVLHCRHHRNHDDFRNHAMRECEIHHKKKSCQWCYLPGLGWRDRCCATPELCRIRNHPQSSAYSFHKRVAVVTHEGMAGHMCNVSSPMWQLKSCINRINICTFTSHTYHTIRVVHKPETVRHSLDITSRTCAAGASQLKCFGGRQWHHGFGQLCLWSETGHMNWKIQAMLKWQAKTCTKSDLVSKEEKHSIRFGVYFTGGQWMSPGTSNLSKQGSPSPTGIPDTTVVTAPGSHQRQADVLKMF